MRDWTSERLAAAAGAELVHAGAGGDGPRQATIDSRAVGAGDLFVGLVGENVDGGAYAADAIAAGAWGVLVAPEHAAGLQRGAGAILLAADPLAALHSLARAWRRELGVPVIAITGSVGKTSTKDLTAAILAPQRQVHASRQNFNTEIGLPLELLAAPPDTEVIVLELAMRGPGQIAELAAICEPEVGVITNIGPVHLEILGTLDAIAAAKAELIAGVRAGGTVVVPAFEDRLVPYLRADLDIVRFGRGGDVELEGVGARTDGPAVVIRAGDQRLAVEVPFASAHMLENLLAAAAAARAVGVTPRGRIEVELSELRGERLRLPGGVTVINDCYNANPLSMRAALDDLARTPLDRRRIAILGDMLELGPTELELHREIGAHAQASGVDVLVTVGPLAAAMLDAFDGESYAVPDAAEAAALACELVDDGDSVLVKGSRGVGLEVVAEALAGEAVPE